MELKGKIFIKFKRDKTGIETFVALARQRGEYW